MHDKAPFCSQLFIVQLKVAGTDTHTQTHTHTYSYRTTHTITRFVRPLCQTGNGYEAAMVLLLLPLPMFLCCQATYQNR